MAKIKYSALVNSIGGKIGGGVMSSWKGLGIVKRGNSNPRQPRTEKQQNIRGMLSDLAGEFYSLSDMQKELWNSYVSMLAKPMSALNAYAGTNQRLQKYFPGIARRQTPPTTPATPEFPLGFTVTPIASGNFCVIWTSPVLTTLTVVADYWMMPGRDSVSNPKWSFGATAGSDATFADVSIGAPAATVTKFRVRTVDLLGRVSPWSHMLATAATA